MKDAHQMLERRSRRKRYKRGDDMAVENVHSGQAASTCVGSGIMR